MPAEPRRWITPQSGQKSSFPVSPITGSELYCYGTLLNGLITWIFAKPIFFLLLRHLVEDPVFSKMSGAARGGSDVIDVMRGDSRSSGLGNRRPPRKRVKTTRAMESMQQENDMDWEEENSSERMPRNHKNR